MPAAPPAFQGPRSLLQRPGAGGPRVGPVTLEGDSRPALLETASFETALPARPLLTFGIGCSFPAGKEPPGWLRVQVRAGERVLAERTLNPRALRGWRDLSVPLDGLGSSATLTFSVVLSDRQGQPIAVPPDMVLAVSEPVIHDLDAYGRGEGHRARVHRHPAARSRRRVRLSRRRRRRGWTPWRGRG